MHRIECLDFRFQTLVDVTVSSGRTKTDRRETNEKLGHPAPADGRRWQAIGKRSSGGKRPSLRRWRAAKAVATRCQQGGTCEVSTETGRSRPGGRRCRSAVVTKARSFLAEWRADRLRIPAKGDALAGSSGRVIAEPAASARMWSAFGRAHPAGRPKGETRRRLRQRAEPAAETGSGAGSRLRPTSDPSDPRRQEGSAAMPVPFFVQASSVGSAAGVTSTFASLACRLR